MKIYYAASSYASHLRAAKAYRALLSRAYPLVNDIASADVVVLHHEPRDFGALYADYPELRRKYVIGYCVWEASELPDAYKESIAHVQEIWTCSAYSRAAFEQHHPNVWCIPHVVARDTKFSPADLAHVRALLRHDPRHVYFLAIALQASRRKNVGALVKAFRELHGQIPQARLVLRTGPGERATFDAEPAIIRLPDTLRWSEINALYAASSAYVSAHHAEGWGLTLSDAMLFRKPVIATGYSGNLEYMGPESSFLVGYAEEHVRPEDCEDLFHSGMKWAYPDEDDLKRQILFVKENEREPAVLDRVRLAAEQLSRFAPASVAALLYARLARSRARRRAAGLPRSLVDAFRARRLRARSALARRDGGQLDRRFFAETRDERLQRSGATLTVHALAERLLHGAQRAHGSGAALDEPDELVTLGRFERSLHLARSTERQRGLDERTWQRRASRDEAEIATATARREVLRVLRGQRGETPVVVRPQGSRSGGQLLR